MKEKYKEKAKTYIRKLILWFFLFWLWWKASENANPLFVPSPKSVLDGTLALIKNKQLLMGACYSFYRVAVASLCSGMISIILGILIYSSKFIRNTMYPMMSLMRYIPVTAFYPLLIMWSGIGEQMKITFLFIAIFVFMLPSTINILMDVQSDLLDTGYTIGMNKLQTIYMILLPAALPSIAQTFIMLFAVGFTYIPFVESINAKYGLGYIIQQSSSRGRTDLVCVGIVAIIAISILFDKCGSLVIKWVFPWRSSDDRT